MKWLKILNESFDVNVIDDKSEISKFRNEIFNLIKIAYSDKGGCKGCDNPRRVVTNSDRAKVVFGQSGDIIAVSLYNVQHGGFKRFASAGIKGNEESLAAVNAIIKSDIEPYDNWYWVEASGAIEHLFKKNNGNPIPNQLAGYFLGMEDDDIVLDDDGVHYSRMIKDEVITKMLFGFKDAESIQKSKELVSDYGEFKMRINSIDKRILESENDVNKMMEESRKFIVRLYTLHIEEGFNEMLPEWHDRLISSMNYIREHIEEFDQIKKRMYNGALNRGQNCIDEMTILEFKRVKLDEL